MAITINTQPIDLTTSRNHNPVDIETDALYSTAPVNAVATVRADTATAGDTFVIEYAGMTLTFGFATPPDDSGLELTERGVMTLAAWGAQLVEDLKDNYYLSRDFEITYGGTIMTWALIAFTAKNPGSDYTLAFTAYPASGGWSNPLNTAGVTGVKRDNFRILCRLEMEATWQAEDWAVVIEESLEPKEDGTLHLDYWRVFHDHLFPYPSTPGFGGYLDANGYLNGRFRLRLCESYGTPVVPRGWTDTDITCVIRGGYSWERAGGFYKYYDTSATITRWNTHRPNHQRVSTTTTWHLTWVNHDASITNLRQKIKLYWKDGTDTTYDQYIFGTGFPIGEAKLFPAGHDLLSLAAVDPLKSVKKWSTWLVNQFGDALTNTMTFWLDDHIYEYEREIWYENSLGGFDPLRITGSEEQVMEGERVTYLTTFISGYHSLYDGERKQTDAQAVRIYKFTTAWMYKDEARVVGEELALTNCIYFNGGFDLLAMIMRKGSIKTISTPGDLFAIEFEVESSFVLTSFNQPVVS